MKKRDILITIPHCSTFIPSEIREKMILSNHEIDQQSDLYTERIFKVDNADCLEAEYSRLLVDLNRAPDDVQINLMDYHDGVVLFKDEFGKKIYAVDPDMDEINLRIEKFHKPFYEKIAELKKGKKFIIDGHSLWSSGPATRFDAGAQRADIVLGNRHFSVCNREITVLIADFFRSKGLSLSLNDPYEGKYLLAHNTHRDYLPGMQIELNRRLYMNEETLQPYDAKINEFNLIIGQLVDLLADKL